MFRLVCHIVSVRKYLVIAALQGNNREITLLPIIEKGMFEGHSKWPIRNDPLDPLQGASQSKCSSVLSSHSINKNRVHHHPPDHVTATSGASVPLTMQLSSHKDAALMLRVSKWGGSHCHWHATWGVLLNPTGVGLGLFHLFTQVP